MEVVKHFGEGPGRRSDYGQNSQNKQRWPKNGQNSKAKKISNFGLCLVYAPIVVPNGLKKHPNHYTQHKQLKKWNFHGNWKMAIKRPNLVKTGQILFHIPYFT